jgi:single-strand DNA-binding protein
MLNKAQIIGYVGKEPEFKDFGTSKVANFTVATTERAFTTKTGVDVPEKTEWHRIVVWGGLANVVEKFVTKGTLLYIEGKMTNREYETQSGEKRFISEIQCSTLTMLGGKSKTDNAYQGAPVQSNSGQSQPEQSQSYGPEDDLPF